MRTDSERKTILRVKSGSQGVSLLSSSAMCAKRYARAVDTENIGSG